PRVDQRLQRHRPWVGRRQQRHLRRYFRPAGRHRFLRLQGSRRQGFQDVERLRVQEPWPDHYGANLTGEFEIADRTTLTTVTDYKHFSKLLFVDVDSGPAN